MLLVVAAEAGQLVVPLVVALIAAVGTMAVGWRRLTVLGHAERDKLIAEKRNIIEEAETHAATRSIMLMQAALDTSKEERDYLRQELVRTREQLAVATVHIAELSDRLKKLETKVNGA